MPNQTNEITIRCQLKEWGESLPDLVIAYMANNIHNKENIVLACNKIVTFLELTKLPLHEVNLEQFFKEFL